MQFYQQQMQQMDESATLLGGQTATDY
jgi:hypothetical protein